MTAGRHGSAAETTQRLWRSAERGHDGRIRQSREALIAVCHKVEAEPTQDRITVECALRAYQAIQ